jgi:hypothetical protein
LDGGGVGGQVAGDGALGEVWSVALEAGEGGCGILISTPKARAIRSSFAPTSHGSGLFRGHWLRHFRDRLPDSFLENGFRLRNLVCLCIGMPTAKATPIRRSFLAPACGAWPGRWRIKKPYGNRASGSNEINGLDGRDGCIT